MGEQPSCISTKDQSMKLASGTIQSMGFGEYSSAKWAILAEGEVGMHGKESAMLVVGKKSSLGVRMESHDEDAASDAQLRSP